MTGHQIHTARFVRGRTPIRPTRNLYGTSGYCFCGWKTRVNAAPSAGGTAEVMSRHRAHLAEQP